MKLPTAVAMASPTPFDYSDPNKSLLQLMHRAARASGFELSLLPQRLRHTMHPLNSFLRHTSAHFPIQVHL